MASHSKELRPSTVGEFLQTQPAILQPMAQVTKHLHMRLDCPVRIPKLGQRPYIARRVNSQALAQPRSIRAGARQSTLPLQHVVSSS